MPLTSPENIKNAGLRVSAQIDNSLIENFINEAENKYIKLRITDALYVDLLEWNKSINKDRFPHEYKILMDGGIYETKSMCGNIEKRYFEGLIKAINYYVHSRIVRKMDENSTRFGFVQKDDQYSQQHDLKTKIAAENDSLQIADIYLSDCILYIEANKDKFPLYTKGEKAKNRIKISIIGD